MVFKCLLHTGEGIRLRKVNRLTLRFKVIACPA
jgi:hypothetical protein